MPTHFSLYVFQPSWARNTARDIWTLWGNGIRASIVRIPTRATTSSVAEPKYTSIAAPKKTKSFSQKYKSKYPNPLQCIVFPTSVEQPHTSKVTSSTPHNITIIQSSVFFCSLTVYIGIVVGAAAALLIITLVSCFCCSCCFLYKKRHPSSSKTIDKHSMNHRLNCLLFFSFDVSLTQHFGTR